ncbi:BglG family transcription antiterminator [Clostridium neonatale]|uniref:BglG family transcription antiterminator n=1 Tax=Clostridium neonatale TaxID=137838 RepID=UPI003D353205
MKIRQKLLLNILLKSQKENIDKLADDFKVSIRTIRNDIDEINDYLLINLNKSGIKLKNKNVYLILEKEDISRINISNKKEDYYTYKLSTEERTVLILNELITNEGYVIINDLCEKLLVSRSTINSDIVFVKKWCRYHNVNLISHKGKGLIIEEDEETRRFLLITIIREYSDLINLSKVDYDPMDIYSKLFRHVNLDDIREIIINAEDEFNYILSDIAFDGLLIHIALSIERNIDKKVLNINEKIKDITNDKEEYKMAQYIIKHLEKKFKINIPTEEEYYIALHIYGKSNKIISNTNEDWIYVQLITDNLIEKVSKRFLTDFRNDLRLYEDLSKHISGTIFRFKNRLTLNNPLKDSLIVEYKDIYNTVKNNITNIEGYIGQDLSDDEIAYIVLHFAAAMERMRTEKEKYIPSVIVTCSTGIGTAKLVLSRLNKYFNFNVIKVIGAHNLGKTLKENKVDFIISTVNIEEDYPSVIVSPLLKENDIENINKILYKLGFINTKSKYMRSTLANEVLEIIEQYHSMEEEEVLKNKLIELLNKREEKNEQRRRGGEMLMLSEVLKEEYISLGEECHDWIEAVRASGEVLVKNNVIDKAYIESAIENVKQLGPYIVITKGVAIPHASNKYGVYKTAISLVRLKEPIEFSSSKNDPVKYVFMLATTDSNRHIRALADLVNLLEDKNFYKCIDEANDSLEIVKYIKQNETKV